MNTRTVRRAESALESRAIRWQLAEIVNSAFPLTDGLFVWVKVGPPMHVTAWCFDGTVEPACGRYEIAVWNPIPSRACTIKEIHTRWHPVYRTEVEALLLDEWMADRDARLLGLTEDERLGVGLSATR